MKMSDNVNKSNDVETPEDIKKELMNFVNNANNENNKELLREQYTKLTELLLNYSISENVDDSIVKKFNGKDYNTMYNILINYQQEHLNSIISEELGDKEKYVNDLKCILQARNKYWTYLNDKDDEIADKLIKQFTRAIKDNNQEECTTIMYEVELLSKDRQRIKTEFISEIETNEEIKKKLSEELNNKLNRMREINNQEQSKKGQGLTNVKQQSSEQTKNIKSTPLATPEIGSNEQSFSDSQSSINDSVDGVDVEKLQEKNERLQAELETAKELIKVMGTNYMDAADKFLPLEDKNKELERTINLLKIENLNLKLMSDNKSKSGKNVKYDVNDIRFSTSFLLKDNKDLEAKNGNLRQQVQMQKEQLANLQTQLDSVDKTIAEQKDALNKAAKDKATVEQIHQQELQDAQSANQQLQGHVTNLTSENSKLTQQLQQAHAQEQQLQTKNNQLALEKDELLERLEDAQLLDEALEQKVNILEIRNNEISLQLKVARQANTDQQQQIIQLTGENETLKQQLRDAQAQFAAEQQKTKKLEATVKDQANQLGTAQSTIKNQADQLTQLGMQYQGLDQSVSQISSENATVKQKNVVQMQQIARMQEENEKLKEQIKNLQEEVIKQHTELASSKKKAQQLEGLNATLQNSRDRSLERAQNAREANEGLARENQFQRGQITELKKQNSQNERKLKELQQQIQEKDQTISRLETDKQQLQGKNDKLTTTLQQRNQKIEEQIGTISDLQNQSQNQAQQINNLTSQNLTKDQKIAKLEQINIREQENRKQTEAENNNLKERLQEQERQYQQQLQAVQTQLQEQVILYQQKEQQLQEKEKQLEIQKQKLEEKQKQIDNLQTQLNTSNKQISELNDKIESAAAEKVQLANKCEELKSQIDKLTATINGKNEQIEQNQADIDGLKADNENKDEQLASKQEELAKLQEEFNKNQQKQKEIEIENENLLKEKAELEQKQEQLQEELKREQNIKTQQNEQIAKLKKESTHQKDLIASLQGGNENLKDEKIALEKKIWDQKKQLTQDGVAITELKEQLRVALEQNQKNSYKLDLKENRMLSLEQELAKQKAQNDELKTQNQQHQQEIGEKYAENAKLRQQGQQQAEQVAQLQDQLDTKEKMMAIFESGFKKQAEDLYQQLLAKQKQIEDDGRALQQINVERIKALREKQQLQEQLQREQYRKVAAQAAEKANRKEIDELNQKHEQENKQYQQQNQQLQEQLQQERDANAAARNQLQDQLQEQQRLAATVEEQNQQLQDQLQEQKQTYEQQLQKQLQQEQYRKVAAQAAEKANQKEIDKLKKRSESKDKRIGKLEKNLDKSIQGLSQEVIKLEEQSQQLQIARAIAEQRIIDVEQNAQKEKDQLQQKHQQEIGEKDAEIAQLREQLRVALEQNQKNSYKLDVKENQMLSLEQELAKQNAQNEKLKEEIKKYQDQDKKRQDQEIEGFFANVNEIQEQTEKTAKTIKLKVGSDEFPVELSDVKLDGKELSGEKLATSFKEIFGKDKPVEVADIFEKANEYVNGLEEEKNRNGLDALYGILNGLSGKNDILKDAIRDDGNTIEAFKKLNDNLKNKDEKRYNEFRIAALQKLTVVGEMQKAMVIANILGMELVKDNTVDKGVQAEENVQTVENGTQIENVTLSNSENVNDKVNISEPSIQTITRRQAKPVVKESNKNVETSMEQQTPTASQADGTMVLNMKADRVVKEAKEKSKRENLTEQEQLSAQKQLTQAFNNASNSLTTSENNNSVKKSETFVYYKCIQEKEGKKEDIGLKTELGKGDVKNVTFPIELQIEGEKATLGEVVAYAKDVLESIGQEVNSDNIMKMLDLQGHGIGEEQLKKAKESIAQEIENFAGKKENGLTEEKLREEAIGNPGYNQVIERITEKTKQLAEMKKKELGDRMVNKMKESTTDGLMAQKVRLQQQETRKEPAKQQGIRQV